MGGLNTWTPIRPFVVKYYDSLLLSDDIKEIRGHYGLNCDEERKFTLCVKILETFGDTNVEHKRCMYAWRQFDVVRKR